MRLLLDTHTLIWALQDNPKLPNDIRSMIVDLDNQIFVSVISIYEIALKHDKYPDFEYNPEEIVNLCQKVGFIFAYLGVEDVLQMNKLKVKNQNFVNKDPFDRLLLSQCKNSNYMFLTHDNVISHYDENFIIYF